MRNQKDLSQSIDWPTMLIYLAMVLFGWINIYAAVYDPELDQSIFDLSINSGKQLLWIGICLIFVVPPILIFDMKFYSRLAIPAYVASLLLLLLVMVLARDIKGAQSWLEIGPVRLQPSELAKVSTALMLAQFVEIPTVKLNNIIYHPVAFAIIGLPAGLIVLQGDAGSALVFGAFIFVMHREGMQPIYIILGLVSAFFLVLTLFFKDRLSELAMYIGIAIVVLGALIFLFFPKKKTRLNYVGGLLAMGVVAFTIVFSIDFLLTNVLEPHQRKRLEILIDPQSDPRGTGYQVTQSMVAIGSGGLWGKGFKEGTQTKFDFVPDQSTDFIFCTVGEEHGWIGSLIVIALFVALIFRVVTVAERQKSKFARAYGYSVACILFFHFMINMGMTIGLFPVIGIPLPFFSYGGSSLIAFTTLLFILVKLDSQRMQLLARG